MDSGRIALLEKAREFGSLAHNMTFQDFLDKSVTYRTLAFYLGIQSEWWDEFWRSFSFAKEINADEKLRGFRFCCRAEDLSFLMMFLSCYFGGDVPISNISEKEFLRASRLVMEDRKDERKNTRLSD